MERIFNTRTSGPVVLVLPIGTARVKVDQTVKTATIRLHTVDSEGPSVDAINRAAAGTVEGLSVTVSKIPGSGGGVTIINGGRGGSYSSVVSSGGGTVIVNGQVISGSGISNGITAEVTMPPGTALRFRSESANLHASGPLPSLDATSISGDIEAGVVGTASAKTTSGDVDIDVVTHQIVATSVSGDIEVGSYSGESAVLSSASGDIALSATREARGALSASSISGDVRLRGAAHLNPQASSVSGRVRA
ncbi:MAG TPA: DUF4097 family beta strand repeat-containing protein [Kofleriaceae bacterium]|nr:DUF4097 family beta strand repeat-containing protein [Kofleriaceae bacterium]